MSSLVQVAVAGDVTEAEEIQAVLADAGIDSSLEPSDEADALAVLVAAEAVESAQDAIESMAELDEVEPDA